MARPILDEPQHLAAYRAELRGLYRVWRLGGLALVLAGCWLLAWPRMGGPWMLGPFPMQRWGWAAMAAGWTILLGVIVARTRYHRARMAEPPAP